MTKLAENWSAIENVEELYEDSGSENVKLEHYSRNNLDIHPTKKVLKIFIFESIDLPIVLKFGRYIQVILLIRKQIL